MLRRFPQWIVLLIFLFLTGLIAATVPIIKIFVVVVAAEILPDVALTPVAANGLSILTISPILGGIFWYIFRFSSRFMNKHFLIQNKEMFIHIVSTIWFISIVTTYNSAIYIGVSEADLQIIRMYDFIHNLIILGVFFFTSKRYL